MNVFRVEPFGSSGILVRFGGAAPDAWAFSRGVAACLSEPVLKDLRDVTPAYGSVLLEFSGRPDLAGLCHEVRARLASAPSVSEDDIPRHEIPVCYDGPDLEVLAERLGMAADEVIRRHAAPEYHVDFLGFSPGFPYLGPLDPGLHVPRLATPRTRVPAGSVAIGGSHTGIYSISSPGGWWLIGRTEVALFSRTLAEGDGSRSAFLLSPGDRVKFVPQAQ